MKHKKTKQWPFDRWCRFIERRVGLVVHRGFAFEHYEAGLKPTDVFGLPFVLSRIFPTHL